MGRARRGIPNDVRQGQTGRTTEHNIPLRGYGPAIGHRQRACLSFDRNTRSRDITQNIQVRVGRVHIQRVPDHPIVTVRANLDCATVGAVVRRGDIQMRITGGRDELDRAVLAYHVGLSINADRLIGRANGAADI